MSRSYVQPQATTDAKVGVYYCYDLQVWIQDGVVLPCSSIHPIPVRGCGQCDLGHQLHGACPSCH